MSSSAASPAARDARRARVFDVIGKRRWFFLFSGLLTIPGLRPGIVSRPENRKNQRRLPMTSNTRARLASRAAGEAAEELIVAHPEQRRTLEGRHPDDDPQDRPGHHDRGEHRDQD